MRGMFWIAGLRVFRVLVYYIFVVPIVFAFFAVFVWIGLAWITWYVDRVALAVSLAVFYLAYRYADRQRRARCL